MDMNGIIALVTSNPLIAIAIAVLAFLKFRKQGTSPTIPAPITVPGGFMASLLARLGPVGASIAALLLARMNSDKVRSTVDTLIAGILDALFPKSATIVDPPPIIIVPERK